MVVVEVLDPSARRYKTGVEKAARWLLKNARKEAFYLEIYLVGDKQMKKNVLSFPALKGFPRPDLKRKALGEIYLNPSYIIKEKFVIRNSSFVIPARSPEATELGFMLIHGFLHLLGYDHIKKSDRLVMEKREALLLRAMPKIL